MGSIGQDHKTRNELKGGRTQGGERQARADGGIGPKTLPDAGVENNRTAIGKIAFDVDLGASARSE